MANIPLLVHFLFHPESERCRSLARHVHQALNADVAVPGLRIPTVFCPTDSGGRPPPLQQLALAEHSFIVALADDRLSVDEDWCRFVADVWQHCRDSRRRYLPFQLSPNAWPLDPRLRVVSFARAHLEPEGAERNAFVTRRLVIELCRYLRHLDAGEGAPTAPLKLFLSHTKMDMAAEPKVTQQVVDYLAEDQPVEAWIDTGDIPAGSEFAKAITQGVADTSLLVILTDHYATREWCREEVLLAKENQRPVAVVDALSRYEARSFPYLGNVPRLRWDGDPRTAVDLLLKETLRHLHTAAVLDQFKQPGDVVFVRPPELATLVGLEPGSTVLYPDPPIGVGETQRLARTKVHFLTPLQRLAASRPLHGRAIALSLSESTDIRRFGLDPVHLEGVMLELSRFLLIRGATLAYGGHLGSEGYTSKLFELVRTHNELEGVQPFERIVNHRGWPLPRLSIEKQAELRWVAKTVELPRPADIDESVDPEFTEHPSGFAAEQSAKHRYAWARGMTEMRAFQSDRARSGIVARVVLGGAFGPTDKVSEDGTRGLQWYQGRIPGTLEEVMLSVRTGQPVFLIGAFGGAARLIIDLLQGRDREEATWEFQKEAPFAAETRDLYAQRGLEWWDYPEMIALLRSRGTAGINPLLAPETHEELFATVDPWRMIEIVLQGLNAS